LSLARISPAEYEDFRRFLEEACGIQLGDNKHYLVQSRLGRMVSDSGLGSLGELVERLCADRPGGTLREQVIEAMTTNETSWFRDTYPFEILAGQVLPDFVQRGQRSLGIWSAACSTGQEPYSISMTVQGYLHSHPGSLKDVVITATDISPAVLEEARRGEYDVLALGRGLQEDIRARYFERDAQHWQERWQVRADIRRRVRFIQSNLLASYAPLGRFEVIFCRNVLIYFSSELKIDILQRMAACLNPGGYLFLGASESISQYSDAFETVRCHPGVVYRKKSS
jgi:chemotaxis protein methyltransferase CheR